MTLAPGTRLGPYEITAPLGAGGMGEVYRAMDTRLDRTVAIKVLPAELAADPEFRQRFEREARSISTLDHPHICALYDIGEHEGTSYLVMQYLEGETLAERLTRGPVPLGEALGIAVDIASALDAAHRRGIVHRDLKPGNVMLTRTGARLLDFGLAKAGGATALSSAAPTALATSPLPSAGAPPLTAKGTILGTFQYMAPEQIEGLEADARSDIFAFGAVLHEMVTGRRAFDGRTQASLIGAILKDAVPPISSVQPLAPASLDRVVQACLEKNPDDRWQTAADLARELRWLVAEQQRSASGVHGGTDAGSSVAAAPISRAGAPRRQAIRWAAAGVLAGGLLTAAAWSLVQRPAPPLVPMQVQVGFAPAEAILGVEPLEASVGGGRPSRTALALSPDGRWLVFAGTRAGQQQLFLRDLTRNEASAIDGTKGGDSPFFSPGGEWVGFWADEALRKVPLGGGPVTEICKTSYTTGANWGGDDRVVFAEGGVIKACTAGTEAVEIAAPDRAAGETSYRLPFLLPGGEDVLFTIVSGRAANSAKVALRSLSSGEQRILMENASDGRYAPSGHLVFIRLGTLMAAPFDAGSLQVTGPAVGIVDNVMAALNMPNTGLDSAAGQFTFSAAGHLVYLAGGMFPDVVGTLVWLDREGKVTPLDTAPRGYMSPQLSPDGQRVAVQSVTGAERAVWVVDIGRGTASRLQFDGLADWPMWTPDGQRIVFSGSAEGIQNLYWMRADGSDRAERLTTSAFNQLAASWSADGGDLIFVEERRETRDDIYALSMADRTTRPVLQNPAGETHPTMSPNGRWLAYVSDDSGRPEVFVMAYGGPVGRVQVSVAGGSNPRWTKDGRALVFSAPVKDGIRTIMSATITAAPALAAGVPRRITAVSSDELTSTTPIAGFDIAADGRLLGVSRRRPSAEPPPTTFNLLLNWTARLTKGPSG